MEVEVCVYVDFLYMECTGGELSGLLLTGKFRKGKVLSSSSCDHNVWMNIVKVLQKLLLLILSIWPHHELVVHILVPLCWFSLLLNLRVAVQNAPCRG